jgi:hypothetical protein
MNVLYFCSLKINPQILIEWKTNLLWCLQAQPQKV